MAHPFGKHEGGAGVIDDPHDKGGKNRHDEHGKDARDSVTPFIVGSLIARLGPGDLLRETILGNEPGVQLAQPPPQTGTLGTSTTSWCIGFPAIQTGNMTGFGYLGVFMIPTGATMTTGITAYITTTDDGAFPSDLGSTTVFGVQFRKITAANMLNTYGTPTEATITMAATSGTMVRTALAVTNANLNAGAAGDIMQMRIYRKGASALDLCMGRILAAPVIHLEST